MGVAKESVWKYHILMSMNSSLGKQHAQCALYEIDNTFKGPLQGEDAQGVQNRLCLKS